MSSDREPLELADQMFGPDPDMPVSDVNLAVERIRKWARQAPPRDLSDCDCDDCRGTS